MGVLEGSDFRFIKRSGDGQELSVRTASDHQIIEKRCGLPFDKNNSF